MMAKTSGQSAKQACLQGMFLLKQKWIISTQKCYEHKYGQAYTMSAAQTC